MPDEDLALWDVSKRADAQFEPWFPSLAETDQTLQEFKSGLSDRGVWVAESQTSAPVGFAVAGDIDGVLWLYQLSVDPKHGRRGIGKSLLFAVISHAYWANYNAVALSTFKEVPFNVPFYEKHGFLRVETDSVPIALAERFLEEIPRAVHPASRALMVKKL